MTAKKAPGKGAKKKISGRLPVIPPGAYRECECAGCGKVLTWRGILAYLEGRGKETRALVLSCYPPLVETRVHDPATGRDKPFCARCASGQTEADRARVAARAKRKKAAAARATTPLAWYHNPPAPARGAGPAPE